MKLKLWLITFFVFAVVFGSFIGYFIQKWWPANYNLFVLIVWLLMIVVIFINKNKLNEIMHLLDK